MDCEPVKTQAWGTEPEMFGPRHEHRLSMFLRETAKLPAGSWILDAATGLGQLARRLERQGHRVVGVDASFEAARHVRRTTNAHPIVCDLETLPFRSRGFDAVTSGETLEHLHRDDRAAGEFLRVLRPARRCIVTVPALRMLWSASDEFQQHRRRYSRSELRRLFIDSGAAVERCSYWGFPLVLLYDLLFLLPVHRRRARSGCNSDPALRSVARAGRSRWLVNLVRTLFRFDRLFAFVPFGPGLILIARKINDASSESSMGVPASDPSAILH